MDRPKNDLSALLPSSERKELIQQGANQLEIWLCDLIRLGLLQYDFSAESMQEISSRMVDAKMGGVARRLRRLASYKRSDPAWFKLVLRELADLHLLVQALRKVEKIPLPLQHTIYAVGGYALQRRQLQSLPGIRDQWLIMGIQYAEEENLKSRYTWIMGAQSKRTALLLDFAFGRTDFDLNLSFEKSYSGNLIYFPASFHLRGILNDPIVVKKIPFFPATFKNIDKYLDIYSFAMSRNPWLQHLPACIEKVTIRENQGIFQLQDQEQKVIPLSNPSEKLWPLLANLAADVFDAFGIWNGMNLQLLSVHFEQSHIQIDQT